MSHQNDSQLNTFFESSPICVTITGLDGRSKFLNQRALELVGATSEQIVGRRARERFYDDNEWRAIIRALNAEAHVSDKATRLKRMDGSLFRALVSVKPE